MKWFLLFFAITPWAQAQWTIRLEPSLPINQSQLRQIELKLNKACAKSNPVSLEVTAMPEHLLPYLKGEIARANSSTWIEVNAAEWHRLTLPQRNLLLIHEIGHTLGLEHVTHEQHVMSQNNLSQTVNFDAFWSLVSSQCKKRLTR